MWVKDRKYKNKVTKLAPLDRSMVQAAISHFSISGWHVNREITNSINVFAVRLIHVKFS